MSASSATGGKGGAKGGGDVRGNPLFTNTSGEKKKIRPPGSGPSEQQQHPEEEVISPAPEAETRAASAPTAARPAPDDFRRPPAPREHGEVPFDEFYTKKTVHFIPILLKQFGDLAKRQHKSQTRLLNEAIMSILEQYGALDEETKAMLEEFGIVLPSAGERLGE